MSRALGRCAEPGCTAPVPPWWQSFCIAHYVQRSSLCARPGCRSGPGQQPGRTLHPSGLCYSCRSRGNAS
jgi:hypothetical protein